MTLRNESRKTILILLISIAATSLLIIGLLFQWGFLAGVEHFKYPYREWLGAKNFIMPFLFAFLLILIFVWGFRKGCKLRSLLFIIVIGYLFQLSLSAAGPHGISGIGLVISDPGITSYYHHASELEQLSLAEYPELMETFFMHARTHPPGPILLIKGTLAFFEQYPSITSLAVNILLFTGISPIIFDLNPHSHIVTAYIVGFLLPFIGCLSSIPIYLFVRYLDDKRSAYIAGTLFLIAPAMSLFLPEFDQFLALFAIAAVAAGWYSFMENKLSYALLSGFAIFLATFFQLLCLCLMPMLFLSWLLLKWRKQTDIDFKGILKVSLSFILGFLLPFIALQIGYGFSIIKVFRKVLQLSQIILEKAPPPGLDILHFSIFLGVTTFVLLLSSLLSKENFIPQKSKSQNILVIAFFVLIIALSLSGKVRAETGRLWIFLMPLASSIAGIELKRLSKNKTSIILIVLFLILLSLFILRGKLAVLNSPIYGNF
jgi:hypothetical protein